MDDFGNVYCPVHNEAIYSLSTYGGYIRHSVPIWMLISQDI